MALKDVKEIITKIAIDKEFRKTFFDTKSINIALAPYKGLTPEERKCLYGLDEKKVEQYARKEIHYCSDIRI